MTSPSRTAWLGSSIRRPLTRTCPDPASAAAAERVRTTRACHSHLSMRCRSKGIGLVWLLAVRLELLLEGGELGERRIRIGLAVATVPPLATTLDVFRAQRGIALGTIAARRTVGAV